MKKMFGLAIAAALFLGLGMATHSSPAKAWDIDQITALSPDGGGGPLLITANYDDADGTTVATDGDGDPFPLSFLFWNDDGDFVSPKRVRHADHYDGDCCETFGPGCLGQEISGFPSGG